MSTDIHDRLKQFHGSETVYRLGRFNYLITEGVRELCEAAGTYWLAELIMTHELFGESPAFKDWNHPAFVLAIWRIIPGDGSSARIVGAVDWNGNQPISTLASQEIEYTDFPFKRDCQGCVQPFTLYSSTTQDSEGKPIRILMLPQER